MTRDQKIARARELREQGWSIRQIAAEVDLARATVHDNLLGAAHRAAVVAKRVPPCPECGEPMMGWSPSAPSEICGKCVHAGSVEKYEQLERLWREGKTWPEIQGVFGWSSGTLSVYIDRGRKLGYDLPYRYGPERRAKAYANRWGVAA